MKECDLFTFYEKLYFHEIQVRDSLQGRLQTPLAILVALFTFLGYMLTNVNTFKMTTEFLIFFGFVLGSLLFLALAVLRFFKSVYNYNYEYLPCADAMEKYRSQLIEFYKENANARELVEKKISKYILNYFVECSSANAKNNDRRSFNIFLTYRFIVISVVFAFLSFIPYRYYEINEKVPDSSLVVITGISSEDGQVMIEENAQDSGATQSQGTTQSQPDANVGQQEPLPPPKRVVKEGADPSSKK